MAEKEKGLAEIGYHAYGATTDHKNYQGNPMPTWAALPEMQKKAWDAAAFAIAKELSYNPRTENLSFGQALQALQKGHKVARAIWGGYWEQQSAYFTDERDNGNSAYLTQVIAFLKDGSIAPAQPYWEDMLANDWKIIS